MSWHVSKLVFSLPLFATLFAGAEMRTVSGYGTGDTFRQALVMAQSDAVMNAGGKVAATGQVRGDVLVRDSGVSSNVLFVSEYKVLEENESFDGVSVRIEAKVCDVAERQFENGKCMTGEGDGSTAKIARLAAIGNAVSDLGVRIKTVAEYDKDVLLKDEAEAVGWAFVTDVEDLGSTCNGGRHKAKVKIKTFASKAESGIDENFSRESSGRGSSFLEAVNNARAQAVFDLDSAYTIKTIYESGEFASCTIRHDWRGFCYGTEVIDRKRIGDIWYVNVRIVFDENENSDLADDLLSASGFGVASNWEDAVEDAKRDAVINAGSVTDVSVTYEEGKEVVEQSRFRALAYVGLQTSDVRLDGDGFSAQVGARLSRDRRRDAECRLAKSSAKDTGTDAYRTYLVARFKSLVAGGAIYDVERVYRGGAILTDACSVTVERENCGFVIDGRLAKDYGEPCTVQVRMHGLTDDEVVSRSVFGVARWETDATAFELARNDAVINACSKVVATGRYDKNELKESQQLFVGKAFIGGTTVASAEKCSKGRLMRVKASVNGSQDGARSVRPYRVDYEAKATSADAAIALARRGLLMKSGAMAKVRMMYEGMELTQSEAEYRANGTLSDCEMQVSRDSKSVYSVHASGRIVESVSRYGEKEVEGIGCGADFLAARREAIAYAILNYKGEISGEEKYETGVFKGGSSVCSAEGFLFKAEIVQCLKNGDGYFVKVHCSFASEEGKLSGGKEKVEALGWGADEETAKADAERNAIDSVFGRKIRSTMSENNGEITSKNDTEQSFADGYVEDTKVEGVKTENGLCAVRVETVVRQRGVDESGSGWSWLGWTVFFFLLFGIIVRAKEKGGKALATIVWLIITIALFLTGHWIMGVVMLLGGYSLIGNDI